MSVPASFGWIDAVPMALRQQLDLPPLALAILWRRGWRDADAIRRFLAADYHTDPLTLPDMPGAVARIRDAIRNGDPIVIWGDFDVDGQTAVALLLKALRALDADVSYVIPSRLEEGHGVSLDGARAVIEGGARLVITVDTGITAHEAIKEFADSNVDVIITDHHRLADELPPALACVNPLRLTNDHDARLLSGAGVAFKLAEALLADTLSEPLMRDLRGIAAIGTIADVVPLTGENRWIVKHGLRDLANPESSALRKALQRLAEPESVTSMSEGTVAFQISPKLNALGRLSDAALGVELLTTEDRFDVQRLAGQARAFNEQRRALTRSVAQGAEEILKRQPELLDFAALVVAHDAWHPGVLGLAASQLAERYGRPALVIGGMRDGIARGSARSIQHVDIEQALSKVSPLLIRYGGHELAAGFSIDVAKIDEFRVRLSREIAAMELEIGKPSEAEVYDLALRDAISIGLPSLRILAPFGQTFPKPAFRSDAILIIKRERVGRVSEHLKLIVEGDTGQRFEIMGWNWRDRTMPEGVVGVRYEIRENGALQALGFESVGKAVSAPAGWMPEIEDWRGEADVWMQLERLIDDPSVTIWQEGRNGQDTVGDDRRELKPTDTLVLWDIPPSRSVLLDTVRIVNPKRIILNFQDSGTYSIDGLLLALMGMAKYAVRQGNRVISLEAAAALTGTTNELIEAAAQHLIARGLLIAEVVAGEIRISAVLDRPAHEDADGAARVLRILDEIRAFRRYLRDASLDVVRGLIQPE